MQILISINQILTLKFRNDIFCANAIDCLIKKNNVVRNAPFYTQQESGLHKQITPFKID